MGLVDESTVAVVYDEIVAAVGATAVFALHYVRNDERLAFKPYCVAGHGNDPPHAFVVATQIYYHVAALRKCMAEPVYHHPVALVQSGSYAGRYNIGGENKGSDSQHEQDCQSQR